MPTANSYARSKRVSGPIGIQGMASLWMKVEKTTWGSSWMPHKFKIAVSG